jgi:hypothetical protein
LSRSKVDHVLKGHENNPNTTVTTEHILGTGDDGAADALRDSQLAGMSPVLDSQTSKGKNKPPVSGNTMAAVGADLEEASRKLARWIAFGL